MKKEEMSGQPLADQAGNTDPIAEYRKVAGKNSGESTRGFIRRHPVLFTALAGILIAVVIYFWKDIEGRKQVIAVEKQATEVMDENTRDMLRLVAKPLVFAIRSEMLRGNIEQVNIFTADMVKEKNVEFIHLIEPGGNILVSTDKKLEGQTAIGMFDESLVNTDSVMEVNSGDNLLTLAVPVMGFDKRLALLVLNYKPVRFDPSQKDPATKPDSEKTQ